MEEARPKPKMSTKKKEEKVATHRQSESVRVYMAGVSVRQEGGNSRSKETGRLVVQRPDRLHSNT